MPINLWFNPSAPRIKSGEVIPDNLNEEQALELMIADPLLIRRPLIHVDGVFRVGFDPEKIDSIEGFAQFRPENRILHAKLYIFPAGNAKRQESEFLKFYRLGFPIVFL